MFIRPTGIRKGKELRRAPAARGNALGRSLNVQPRVPHWWSREVRATAAVAVCPRCHAIYYDKHWHTWSNPALRLPTTHPVRETLCRACESEETKGGKRGAFGYEGELMLSGLSEGPRKTELLRLVRNAGTRATRRDPEDRIIKVEDKGATVRITTSVNQLAVSLGKQVAAAAKGGTLTIRWSEQDLPVRVSWKSGR